MTSDDPFAEPFDTDKTVIRPNPAGRRPTPAPSAPPPPTGHQAHQPTPPPHSAAPAATRMSPSAWPRRG